MNMNWKTKRGAMLLAAMAMVFTGLGSPTDGSAQSINMADYTNYPMFLNKSGPTNILFIVDLGNAQLPAAYGAYPISAKQSTVTVNSGKVRYASNVNMVDPTGALDLVSSSDDGSSVNSATTSAPHDPFNPNKEYYGFFDPYRCYLPGNPHFDYGSKKVDASNNPSVSVQCATNMWDGNFLNWLGMRKKEVTLQALIGGKTLSASSNTDGTADSMAGEDKTGEDGNASFDCSSQSKPCWRYVKWVPVSDIYDTSTPPNLIQGGYTGRMPTNGSLTADTAGAAVATPSGGGRFFGLGEGALYLNVNNTIDPFDGSGPTVPLKIQLSVNLNTEPDVPPAGSAATSSNLDKQICYDTTDPMYAGARACYKRDRSLGLFQKMRKDLFRVGILFADNVGGKGGYLQFRFDDDFNPSAITNIRNQAVKPYAPMAEATYEGLCLYRNQQGACYSNSPADFVATTGTRYDPFWVCDRDSSTGNCKSPTTGQLVPCCKSFILMVSPGIPKGDGNNPDLAQFTNLMSTSVSNIGLTTTQLDDVAYYGRTHDIRDQSNVSGVQNVTFYAVNAMGRAAGAAVLASASKFGGFDDKNRDNVIDLTGSQPCTYPAGSPLGTGTSTSNPEWDQVGLNPSTGDYDGPPDCIPDTYFAADEGGDIEKAVNKAIADILKRSASGTAISVLASSATGDGTIYQAYFFPEEFDGVEQVRWTGYVQGLWVDSFGNLREDNGNHKLVYTEDNIVETCLDSDKNAKFVRYVDSDGDGKKDSTTVLDCNTYGVDLRQMAGVWEAGKKLALRDISAKPRNLFTWVDLNNNGRVDSGEQMAFNTSGTTPAALAPYLRASAAGSAFTSTNLISFFLGNEVAGMRTRTKKVDGIDHVWRLGDVINSTPTIVGAPRERFDILYGDQGYRGFSQRWKNRRLMTYVGSNDGMLHAFNGGYFHRGDDPGSTEVEHGYYTTGETADDATRPELGEEVWGFIPYYILPQLRWLAQPDYTHVSFVDLKPKVTEVRIFAEESDCGGGTTPTAPGCKHPGGWGTIMIVGLRYGGSCKACTAVASENNGGPKLTVTADFNGDGDTTDAGDTRDFLSGYIVLDITDPDVTPTVLSAYTADKLGLTTSYPTVVRMSPSSDNKNDHTNARFFMVVGSGQHGYDGRAASGTFGGANVLAFQLVLPNTTPEVRVLPVGSETFGGFMGDPITFDRDLDFRSDAVYVGRTIDPNAVAVGNPGYWWGKFYRLTMGSCSASPCLSSTWGVDNSGNRSPTEMIEFVVPPPSTTKRLGPVTAGSTVTLDNAGNTWVFFGTGRFFSRSDKTDLRAQYLVGMKDKVLNGACIQATVILCSDGTNTWNQDLLDVSNAQICVSCGSGTQVQNVAGVTTFAGLVDAIQGNPALSITAKDGWFIELQSGSTTTGVGGERSLVNPTLIGGAVFFPTFVPSTDICVAAGNSYLYSMYYLTGTGYTDPIMGVDASGMAARRTDLGAGVASSVAIQIGSQPTGMAGFYQSSNSVVSKVQPKPISSLWSQFISWMSNRE